MGIAVRLTVYPPESTNRRNWKLLRKKQTMKIMTSVLTLALIGTVSAYAHCGSCAADQQTSTHSHDKDLVAVAQGAGSFNTLVAAVKAAGLVETLQGKGPFTIFAPTDEAFAKLPKGTVESLLKPENKDKLIAILTYHVVAGKVMAADVKTMEAKTVNGKMVEIVVNDYGVKVGGSKVVKTDVLASNGVIHVVDTVILPKA